VSVTSVCTACDWRGLSTRPSKLSKRSKIRFQRVGQDTPRHGNQGTETATAIKAWQSRHGNQGTSIKGCSWHLQGRASPGCPGGCGCCTGNKNVCDCVDVRAYTRIALSKRLSMCVHVRKIVRLRKAHRETSQARNSEVCSLDAPLRKGMQKMTREASIGEINGVHGITSRASKGHRTPAKDKQ
jgi:peptidoglycan hydrolase-like protein with peptidoglycan-binding domain